MGKTYNVWVYARTADPDRRALQAQCDHLVREAAARGYHVVHATQEHRRGTALLRPGLVRMLLAVATGRADAVMVKSLDRLGYRVHFLYRVLCFLQDHNAVLITAGSSLRFELYQAGLENRLFRRASAKGRPLPWPPAEDDPAAAPL